MSMTRPVGVVLNNIYWNVWSTTQFYIRNSCFHRVTTWLHDWFLELGLLSKNWFLCTWKSHAGGFSTNFYCWLQQNTRLWRVFPKKMNIQITRRMSTGWLREKFMVRKPRVKERKSLVLNCTVYWICCSHEKLEFSLVPIFRQIYSYQYQYISNFDNGFLIK